MAAIIIAEAFVSKVAEYLFAPVKHSIRYVISSKRFANDLRKEVLNLQEEVQRIEVLAAEASNNVRNLYVFFTRWEASAETALEKGQNLLDRFEKACKIYCGGTPPNPKWRYKFSRKSNAIIKDIRELAGICDRFRGLDDISCIDPDRRESEGVVQSTTARDSGFSAKMWMKLKDAGVFESRALMIGEIMDAFADNSNNVVGVYGMGGIGKSTLLGEVKGILSEEKFDWVAEADVSKNPDIKRIQGEIADALGLTDMKHKEIISERAAVLHQRLEEMKSKKKKVLIILDNLWTELDLKSVGIPCGPENGVIGCTLLLASRDSHVLLSKMGCGKVFPLHGLKEDEAERLFEMIVGDKVHDDGFKPLVKVALDKCAGVPFLIVEMAKRLRKAEIHQWRDTLKIIEKSKDDEFDRSDVTMEL